MIEKAIASRLSAASSITNLVSTRIYSLERPQVSDLPAIIFTRISTDRDDMAHDGAMGAAEAIMQVSCYSETLSEAMAISEQVRLLFHGWEGTAGGVEILLSKIVNENVFLNNEEDLKSVILDLSCLYREDTIS